MTRPQWLLAADRHDRAVRAYRRALADPRRFSSHRRWRVKERLWSLFCAELEASR